MENDSRIIVVDITEILTTFLLRDGWVIDDKIPSLVVSMLDEASKGICTNSIYEELLEIVKDKHYGKRTGENDIIYFEGVFQHSIDTFLLNVTNQFSLYGLLIIPSSAKLINRTLMFRCVQS